MGGAEVQGDRGQDELLEHGHDRHWLRDEGDLQAHGDPNVRAMANLKKAGRYLVAFPRLVMVFNGGKCEYQYKDFNGKR